MPEIPEEIRFHFARQASSPWNWYTKPDFAGCALKWKAPEGNVAFYIVFRSSESLPSDCCEDLLGGVYDDIVDRIDIFKPVTHLVDDQIHDRNRYLVLAKMDNDDIVWVKDVESTQFVSAKPGEAWTYWSNPYGDKPLAKDPCRLDYQTVRVGTFCGFEWDYPSQYPDFVGYDLIVSDVPYSPHTGAECDIQAFQAVLRGMRGMTYPLERFVNTVVDNESFVNRFWYYALLVKLPEGGRVQIPIRHIAEPFEKGRPFQYLRARPSWGEGRDRMMAAYGRWRAQMTSGGASASASVSEVPEPLDVPESIKLEYFRHAPDLSFESFRETPGMIGIQFRAKVAEGTAIIAVRAKHALDGAETERVLEEARQHGTYCSDECDAFYFCPNNGYMLLVDTDCHEKSWYAFASYLDGKYEAVSHVKDSTIDFLPNVIDAVRWGESDLKYRDRVVHFLKCEEIHKKNSLSLEFGVMDEANTRAIELYRFDHKPEWGAENLEDLHKFQTTGKPELGKRYVIDHVCAGVIDDLADADETYYYSALSVDLNDNRSLLAVYTLGNVEREDLERLSDLAGESAPEADASTSEEAAHSSEADTYHGTSQIPFGRSRYEDDLNAGGRRKYSWDDEDEASQDETSPEDAKSEGESYGRRKYSWDDEASSDETKSEGESYGRRKYSWDDEASSDETKSEGESYGRRKYSWDDEASSDETKSEGESYGRRKYSWDDEASSDETKSEGESYDRRKYSWDDEDEAEEDGAVEVVEQVIEEVEPVTNAEVAEAPAGPRKYSWDDEDEAEEDGAVEVVEQVIEEVEPIADAPVAEASA
ncbi:MAG: hypothetical protein IJ165_08180, partial [Proteobacteria bacterium]|nr:hypothetical protein [Pseudomonadota bacterium]